MLSHRHRIVIGIALNRTGPHAARFGHGARARRAVLAPAPILGIQNQIVRQISGKTHAPVLVSARRRCTRWTLDGLCSMDARHGLILAADMVADVLLTTGFLSRVTPAPVSARAVQESSKYSIPRQVLKCMRSRSPLSHGCLYVPADLRATGRRPLMRRAT